VPVTKRTHAGGVRNGVSGVAGVDDRSDHPFCGGIVILASKA
jgi:hypothetical protein